MTSSAFQPAPRAKSTDLRTTAFYVQIPVHATTFDEARSIGTALARAAGRLMPQHIDTEAITAVDTKGLRECLVICGLHLWNGSRCSAPYGHQAPCT